jgi:gliding motility-associated-like protein
MWKHFAMYFLLCAVVLPASAQLIISADTTICDPEPVVLEVLSSPSYGTTSYTFEEIDYAPETYAGTSISLSDDSYGGPYSIGFTFCFLGNEYTQFYIGSNGWLSFGGPGALSTTYTSASIPSTAAGVPKNCIMGPWQDWHPGLCGGCIKYQTIGTAPNRKLVLSFDNVPMFSCTTTYGKFQIVLYETTNIVENHITNKDFCGWAGGTATQGVHSLDGTVAFVVPGRNSTSWTADNETVRFVPSGITWYDDGGDIVGYGDSITVTPGATTTYTAEVESCDGLTYTSDVTITVGDDDASFSYGATSFCPDDIITPTSIAIPGGTFSIDPPDMPISSATGTVDLSGGEPGTTYTIEYLTPPGPCQSSSTVNITITPFDDASVTYDAPSFCPTGTTLPDVVVPGGTFTISPSGLVISPTTGQLTLSTGTIGTTYTITYTTAGFCPATATTTVTIDPLDDPAFSYDTSHYCPSGVAIPEITTPGGIFSITPASMSINATTGELNLATGIAGTTYTINYTTPSGPCSTSSTQTVTIDPLDIASFGYSAPSYCAGGTVSPSFITTPGGTFAVSPADLDVDPATGAVDLTTGTVGVSYAITYTTPAGPCSNSGSVTITIDPNDDSTFTYTADTYCPVGSTIPTVITPGGNFTASPAGLSLDAASGNINLAASTPGTYTITYVTPAGFCSSSSSEVVTIEAFTDAYFEYDASAYCPVGSILPTIDNPGGTFNAVAGLDMDLTTGAINLSGSTPGGPYNIIYNSPGCTEQDTFQLTVWPLPVLSFSMADLICYESAAIPLNAVPAGGTFTGAGVSGTFFDPGNTPAAGDYVVTYTYTDGNGCINSTSDNIEVIQNIVDAGPDVSIVENTSTLLLAEGGTVFTWSPETGLVCSGCQQTPAQPFQTTTYTVTSYDDYGCVAADDVTVTVVPFDDLSIFVPNTFTPNGDLMNDYLLPMGSDISMIRQFTIYDRWGEVLWRGENIPVNAMEMGWNGTGRNGMPAASGVYAWVAEVEFIFGVSKVAAGNVMIMR